MSSREERLDYEKWLTEREEDKLRRQLGGAERSEQRLLVDLEQLRAENARLREQVRLSRAVTDGNVQEVEQALQQYYARLARYLEEEDPDKWESATAATCRAPAGCVFRVRFQGQELDNLLALASKRGGSCLDAIRAAVSASLRWEVDRCQK